MIEILIIAIVLFIISILFYKRAQEDVNLLQIDNIDKLGGLLSELSPVIVKDFGIVPPVWKSEKIMGGRLGPIIKGVKIITPEISKNLAEESGLRVWLEHTIYEKLFPEPICYLFWNNCYACIGDRGLWKTIAYTSIIIATDNVLTVTLMNKKYEEYLPTGWKGRDLDGFTKDDGALITNLKTVDIILRPGTLLCVPPHWYVSVKGATWWSILEVCHPISWMAEKLHKV